LQKKPLKIRDILDKDLAFTEQTLERIGKKQSGPPSSAPQLVEVAIELLRHRTDTGPGDEPLGPASWRER
jgi:hypothetical protein